MATDKDATDKAPAIVEAFVRQLVVTEKAVMLYPLASSIPQESAVSAIGALNAVLDEYSDVTITIAKDGMYFDDAPIFPGQPGFLTFSQELYNRRLALVRFHAGATAKDLITFLSILKQTPDEITAAGGFEAMVWEQGVGTITVVETQVTIVDQSPDTPEDAEETAEAPTSVVQMRSTGPRSRERIEISRVFGSESKMREYLAQRADSDGAPLTISATEKRFVELARMAAEHPGAASDPFIRVFAEALWDLDPDYRHELMGEAMLPEAKGNDALAGVVRRIDLDEIMRMLADGQDEFSERRSGFGRALKNLAQVTFADRESVAKAAGSAMREVGVSEDTIHEVIAEAAPTKLQVKRVRTPDTTLDGAAAAALQFIDRARVATQADGSADPEVAALQEEAAAGISESDIVSGLVALAGLDSRDTQFANTMSVLEDTLDALIARGDFEAASEAAITLIHAARNPKLSREQCTRLENAVSRFARPEDVREITRALRLYSPGQPEYDSAQRLLTTLGVLAIRPLLEQLAEETDRGERKALVDLISRDAAKYITELAEHIGDNRWFFVRNVVLIIGSTKSAAGIPALQRALYHVEARVRREAIRALSAIQERRATEMLITALDDQDANNVQLAARYLGLTKTRTAIASLEAVARGEGSGNRENGPRIDAIEALGRIGSPEALPTLQALARKRALIGAARVRELRTAAQAAIAAIKAQGGQL